MTHPIEDIENDKAQTDLGIFAFRLYKGAISDGASPSEAFIIVSAWFKAMLTANNSEES